MGIGKILGIGLATVGSLGLIGGITAAVVTKQNATTSLNTVNSSEDKTTLVNKQEDKKEEVVKTRNESVKENKKHLTKEEVQEITKSIKGKNGDYSWITDSIKLDGIKQSNKR